MEDLYSGKELNGEETVTTAEVVAPVTEQEPMPIVTPPTPVPYVPAADDVRNAPVGFGTYFGLIFLYSIPVIGWIACILMMFIPKRRSLKNYARAVTAWLAIEAAILYAIVSLISSLLVGVINSELGMNFSGIGEVVELANGVANGDFRPVLKQFKNQIPEEYQPLVEVLTNDEYADLVDKILAEDYAGALEEITGDAAAELKEQLGEDMYNEAIGILEEAANGNVPEELESLKELQNLDVGQLLEGILGGSMNADQVLSEVNPVF